MKAEIQILALIQSLILVTQVVALFVQYRVNRHYLGIGWWVLGSSLIALGTIFMPLVTVKSLLVLAMIANPLMILGQIFLYVGVMKFLDKKVNTWALSLIFIVCVVPYYNYMFGYNDISARTIVINCTIATIMIMTAFKLFAKKGDLISVSANFTATAFLIYGCLAIIRALLAFILPPMQTYSDQEMSVMAAFIVPTITSTLWTFGFIIMLNQRLNIENVLEKEKMQLFFNTNPDAAMITRLEDGLFIDVNEGFSFITGYTHDEIIGNFTAKINLWHSLKDRQIFLTELEKKGIYENREFVFRRKDGSEFVGMISARIISIHDVPHIIAAIHDITERKQFEEALLESEEQYRSILNACPDDITITDLQGRILMVSTASKKMYGYEEEYEGFLGMQLVDFITSEDVERAKYNLEQMHKGAPSKSNEYHAVRKDNSIFHIEVNSDFIRNANGQPIKMLFMIRNITERKLAEEKIQLLVQQLEIERNAAQLNSITDSLTGLANRRYFDEVLEKEFYRLKRSGSNLSLIMLDVDYFKKYNDTYGHISGDDCLRKIGNMLLTIVGRTTDVVARYGGEEFVAILPETELNGARALAERIGKAMEELSIPHADSDISKFVTVSMGVVTACPTALESPEQLVTMVDEAMYCAKKAGRNRIEVATNDIAKK